MDSDTLKHIQALANCLEQLRIAHAAYAAAADDACAEPLSLVLDAVIGVLNENDALRLWTGVEEPERGAITRDWLCLRCRRRSTVTWSLCENCIDDDRRMTGHRR